MGNFVVGDSGTIVSPDHSVDADLSDDRWYPFTPAANFTETPMESTPPSQQIINEDVPHPEDKPTGSNRDEWAAGVLIEAWQQLFGTVPSPVALQAVQSIARLESSYGWPNAEKAPEWQGHHNWGSVHCLMRVDGKLKSCMQDGVCVKGFMSKDTIDGRRVPVCFASFPTNVEGAAHFLKTLLIKRPNVKAVIDSGDAYRIALEMRKTSYFMRTKSHDLKDMKADAAYYAGAMMGSAKRIAANRNTQVLLKLSVPSNVDPSDTNTPSWPHDTTDMTDYSPASSTEGALGPVAGIVLGIGAGLLGIWGYKKWLAK